MEEEESDERDYARRDCPAPPPPFQWDQNAGSRKPNCCLFAPWHSTQRACSKGRMSRSKSTGVWRLEPADDGSSKVSHPKARAAVMHSNLIVFPILIRISACASR
jgi:hypothetical protein